MNYNEAITEASNGKMVKRKCWRKTVFFMRNSEFISAEHPHITTLSNSKKSLLCGLGQFTLTAADEAADDWEVFEYADCFDLNQTESTTK